MHINHANMVKTGKCSDQTSELGKKKCDLSDLQLWNDCSSSRRAIVTNNHLNSGCLKKKKEAGEMGSPKLHIIGKM